MTIEELQAREAELRSRAHELWSDHSAGTLTDEARSEWDSVNIELETVREELEEKLAMRSRIEQLDQNPTYREEAPSFQVARAGRVTGEDIYDLSTIRSDLNRPERMTTELRDRAMRSIEGAHFPHERADRARAQGHIEQLLERSETNKGDVAMHLLRTGSPTYRRAFGKHIMGQTLSSEERTALAIGSTQTGGAAVPYTLDPTVIPTSNLSVNPYRAISRVETIAGSNQWLGVTSAGVTARYSAEGTQTGGSGSGDDAPSFEQPTATVQRAESFIPFSIEIQQDWAGLQTEMARLLQDAKDDLEAEKFTSGQGDGNNEPEGILVGADHLVHTDVGGAFSSTDLYKIEGRLGPRFRPNAKWVGNRAIYNRVRQFDTSGGADLWVRLPQGLTNQVPVGGNINSELIGYPSYESSAMDSTVTGGDQILVFGDWRYFLIVDRIGLSIEVVPHLFGENGKPTGQRGFLAYWRNTSLTLDRNAFRTLIVSSGSGSGSGS